MAAVMPARDSTVRAALSMSRDWNSTAFRRAVISGSYWLMSSLSRPLVMRAFCSSRVLMRCSRAGEAFVAGAAWACFSSSALRFSSFSRRSFIFSSSFSNSAWLPAAWGAAKAGALPAIRAAVSSARGRGRRRLVVAAMAQYPPFLPMPTKVNSFSTSKGLNQGRTPVRRSVWRPKWACLFSVGGRMVYFTLYLPGPKSLMLSP